MEFDIDAAVRRYADMVYRLARVNCKNESTADDVFQEVFLKLLRYQDSIKSEEHLKAWLITVTLNQCKSMFMSTWNKRKVSIDEIVEPAIEDQKEDYSELYEAVRELPQKYREAIHLFYFEQMSIREIAGILNRQEGTIKTQLNRGRQMLSEKLKRNII